jgi:Flp pilus assembly protein TadG
MRIRRSIEKDQRGAAMIEAAVAVPVLVSMIYGIFAIGQLFEANAGMEHALGEAARYATLCSSLSTTGSTTTCAVHSGTEVKAMVATKLFGANNGNGTWDTPTLDTSTASSGYVTLTVTYHPLMKFAFYSLPSFTVTRSKRIYLADIPGTSADCSGGTSTVGSCAIYN